MGAQTSGNVAPTADYQTLEAGTYAARCIQVVELGTHTNDFKGEVKDRKELMLVFETGEQMEDGRPFTVNWRGTNTLNEKGTLYKMLTAWRGKTFTPSELARFELKNILDKCCLCNVLAKESKNGRVYNSVGGIMPLPKGMACADRVNELVDFGIGDLGTPEAEKVWPWVMKIILESHEAKGSHQTADDYHDDQGSLDAF